MRAIYIMQGVPGSGKSTVAKMMQKSILLDLENGDTVSIRSTDDQFMVDGKYCFDQSKLGGYHMKNVFLVERDCQDGVNVIIVDNTNIKQRDAKPYIELAKKYNYSYTFVQVFAGLAAAKQRNAERPEDRKIPEHVIERMVGDMQTLKAD